MCTVTLTSEIWQWVKAMTHPWVMDNNCVKYYPDPTWQWGVMARTQISSICALWPWPWRYDLGPRSWHTLGSWTTIVWTIFQIQLGSEEFIMAQTRISSMCALWPWPWRYDLGSRSWHTLGSWTTIVWNIIQIKLGSEELWPGHAFPVCLHCDLDLGDMTLGQGHDTTLGHGQQLCEIISRSDKGVRSYGPDTMWIDGQTDKQTDGQTDRQTDRVIPIYPPPQTLFAGGIIKSNFTSFLTEIKSIVTAVKIVPFYKQPHYGHFTTEFRKKFLAKWIST